MEELVAGSLRSMQAGLAPLKQQAPPAVVLEHSNFSQSVKSDLDTAAEAVKKEVSSCASSRIHVLPPHRHILAIVSWQACLGATLCLPLQVSKLGLMWGGELKPTAAEAAPLLRDLSERVLHLFALYNGIRLAAGAGSTLAQDLAQRASGVMTAAKVTTHEIIIKAVLRGQHAVLTVGCRLSRSLCLTCAVLFRSTLSSAPNPADAGVLTAVSGAISCGSSKLHLPFAVQALLDSVVVAGDAGRLHMLVGRVFNACDAAKAPAHDNRTAIGRALTAVLRSCADSLREARELTDGRSRVEADEQGSTAADADFEADECMPQVCCPAIVSQGGHTSAGF